jgi:hypothetical protein
MGSPSNSEQSDVECSDRLSKRETLPVADADGTLLGSCAIRKFIRQAGKAYNQILLFDLDRRRVAEICGFRLHSRVCCGECEANCKRIDSKDAVPVARAALEHTGDSEEMLAAIQDIAGTLAEQRLLQRRRSRDR